MKKSPRDSSVTTSRITLSEARLAALGDPWRLSVQAQGPDIILIPDCEGFLISRRPGRPGYHVAIKAACRGIRKGRWRTRLVQRKSLLSDRIEYALKLLGANALTLRPMPRHLRWRRKAAPSRATRGNETGP